MIIENDWLTVGFITSCHGIYGQVKVKSLSDFDERFLKPGMRWLQKKNEHPLKVELISGFKQPGKEAFIVKFQGINTRNHAEQLKKFKILVKTDKLPKLKKEEFHLLELINLEVKALENDELKIIGKVTNLENEKNNLLVIELFKNQKKVLIPFVKEIVPVNIPTTSASFFETIPSGIGLSFVRSIVLSMSSSNHILIAAEEPAPNAIATITRKLFRNVICPGAKNIPTNAVKITKDITLGFISS